MQQTSDQDIGTPAFFISAFKMGEYILSLLARKPLAAQYIVRKSVSDMGPNI
ncbi:hypothetical protein I0600191H4_08880 [Collinsella sp. i06-0019-1H4]